MISIQTTYAQNPLSSQQYDFGSAELLSCSDALRTHAPIYLGLDIIQKEGWHVALEDMTLSTSSPVPIEWFTPFEHPFRNRFIYPISAVLTEKPEDAITFKASGILKACDQNNCATHPFSLEKTLNADFAFITAECDDLSQALARVPIPMYMGRVNGWAVPQKNQQIQVTLDFPRPPKTIQVYTSTKQLLTLDVDIKQERVQFLWPLQKNDLHFFVRTYYGYYDIILPLSPLGTSPPTKRMSFWQLLQIAILFFLLSAFPIFWARSTEAPYKVFLKQIKQTLILILCTSIVFSCLAAYDGSLNLTFMPLTKRWTLIGMGLGIIFIPAHFLLPFLFTFLAPRPYLSALQNPTEQLIFIILATIFTGAAFIAQWIYSKKIFKKLNGKRTTSCLWWCFRLPWLFLMLYTWIYL